MIEEGEACDDANPVSLDGCSDACAVETGYACHDQPSICARAPVCGDGICATADGEDPTTCPRDCPCIDADHDGFNGNCAPLDCDDTNPAVHPGAAELCNGIDDDCNGMVDDGANTCAACIDGATQPCYNGPAPTRFQGMCQDGTQTCASGQFGACVGQVLPIAERCNNGVDDDCDGLVDEAGCVP